MKRQAIIFLQKRIYQVAKSWYPLFICIVTLMWSLAWLAPLCLTWGRETLGQGIYRLLAPHDHQLPQRSYFLFSQAGGIQTYTPEQLVSFGADPNNWRAFVGNPRVGYKTALNQRMLAIFTAMLIGALLWPWLKSRLRVLYLIGLLLPMLIDAISHRQSEEGTVGTQFRQTNRWAVTLSGGLWPDSFYIGSTLGGLNWLLRTSTGLLFGFGLVCLLLFYLDNNFSMIKAQLEPKLKKLGVIP